MHDALSRVEWASKGIRVLDVAPGYVVTDLNRQALESGPVRDYIDSVTGRRPGTSEDIARLVAALCSEDIPFLTGENDLIDGGHGIAH